MFAACAFDIFEIIKITKADMDTNIRNSQGKTMPLANSSNLLLPHIQRTQVQLSTQWMNGLSLRM